jgi:hypothetical protein
MRFRVFWDVAPCSHVVFEVSYVRTAAINMAMMEAVHTTETSVKFNVTTQRYIPEHSKIHV